MADPCFLCNRNPALDGGSCGPLHGAKLYLNDQTYWKIAESPLGPSGGGAPFRALDLRATMRERKN